MAGFRLRLLALLSLAVFLVAVVVGSAAGRVTVGVNAVGGHLVAARAASGATTQPLGVSPKGSISGAVTPYGVEVPSLRSRFGDVYSSANGERVAVLSPSPLNYQDATGAWQPIDDSLVARAGGGFQNAANSFSLQLPSDLSSPVVLTSGGNSLSFVLNGAAGAGSVAGASDSFATGISGVSASFASVDTGVKEALTLANANVPKSFSYTLNAGGLIATRDGSGPISFNDGSGGAGVFVMPAAFMVDGNGAVGSVQTSLVAGSAGSYALTLTPDRRWLSDPARVFPVRLDPSVNVSPSPDCTISGGSSANTNFCAATTLNVGWDGSSASRSVLKFDVSSVPADAVVLNAQLKLYLGSETTSTSTSVGLYALTRAFTSGVTWNKYDGSNSWTSPGGDFTSTAAYTNSAVGGTTGSYVSWWPTTLVQNWVDGATTNNGLIVKQTAENQTNVLSFNSQENSANKPLLVVTYQWRLGELKQYTYERQQLDDRMGIAVNVGNGNLIVHNADIHLPGTAGMDLNVDRYFNNLSPNTWYVGNGWNLSTAKDTRISTYGDGSLEFVGASGDELPFTLSGTTLNPPPGLDMSLVKNGDSSYTGTWVKSGEQYHWPAPTGGLTSLSTDKTKNGGTITINYGTGALISSILDTKGISLTFTHTSGLLTQISDPTGRTWKYAYDTHNNLHTYTDPNNKTTTYDYDPSTFDITKITDPLGNQTKFTYDSSHRLLTVTRVTNIGAGTGRTTTYAYPASDPSCTGLANLAGVTTSTDPLGHKTVYCYDFERRVIKTTDPLGHSQTVDWTNATGGANCLDEAPCSSTDAYGKTTTFGYNQGVSGTIDGSNLLYSQSPLEGTTNRPTFAYGSSTHTNYLTQYTNPQGHSWTYAYDEGTGNTNGNLTSGGPTGQKAVKFSYDSTGSVLTATPACVPGDAACTTAGTATSYTYNNTTDHNLNTITPPSPLHAVSITYDSLNRIHTVTDGNGNTRTYTYDPLDRITQIAFSSGPTLTFGYDADGNLTSESDPSGSYGYGYDALNRMTSQTLPGSRSLSYGYDDASNLTSLTDPSGTTTYGYDNANELTSILTPGSVTSIGLKYDNNGNRTEIDYPTTTPVSEYLSYDNAQRLASIVAKTSGGIILNAYCYSYANGSNDTDLRQSVSNQSTTIPGCPSSAAQPDTITYSYDSLDRLVGSSDASTTPGSYYNYLYDGDGNLCAKYSGSTALSGGLTSCSQTGTGITDYSLNAANEVTNSGFSYDNAGNQTADPGIYSTASYNQLEQTSSITPTGGSATSLGYNALSQALRVTAGSTTYTNDILGLNNETGSPATYYTRTTDGTTVGFRRGSTSYYLLFDGLGSVVGAIDNSGLLSNTFTYDPYGNTTSSSGSVYEPIRYAGGYDDTAHTGGEHLTKFGNRYYDPSTSRWTQMDAANDPLDLHGWNQYNYASADPINLTDPSGDCIICSNPLGVVHAIWRVNDVVGSASVRAAGGVLLVGAAAAAAGTVVLGAACFVGGGELEPFHCLGGIAVGALATSFLACSGVHAVKTGRNGFCLRTPR